MARLHYLKPGEDPKKKKYQRWYKIKAAVLSLSLYLNLFFILYYLYINKYY